MGGGTDSSSGEEDGDAEWKAAIDSVTAANVSSYNGLTKPHMTSCSGCSLRDGCSSHGDSMKSKAPGVKLYQIKAQKLLDDLLDKNIEISTTFFPSNDHNQTVGGVIRLFGKSPPGLRLDYIDSSSNSMNASISRSSAQKKPRIIPGEELDEKSKKFQRSIQSAAVSGFDVMAAAGEACRRSTARWKARQDAAKAAAKLEEERVAELKRVRGEEWLPSVAREMKVNF